MQDWTELARKITTDALVVVVYNLSHSPLVHLPWHLLLNDYGHLVASWHTFALALDG